MSNEEIVEDALVQITTPDTFREFKVLLDGVLRRETSEHDILAIYMATALWHNQTDDLRLSDIAYIRAGIQGYFGNKKII